MVEKPVFQKLTQVAMVVKDVEETARRYWQDVGVGPWSFYTIDPSNAKQMKIRGKPVEHAFRAALATIGDISWELIQPLDEKSIYAEHLKEHGEGLHHVAFAVNDLEDTKVYMQEQGYTELQSGELFDLTSYTYLDTDKTLACITEIGSVKEGEDLPPPDFIYPEE